MKYEVACVSKKNHHIIDYKKTSIVQMVDLTATSANAVTGITTFSKSPASAIAATAHSLSVYARFCVPLLTTPHNTLLKV